LSEPDIVPARGRQDLEHLHALYVERFNRQDWEGVRDLVRADARLAITNLYTGPLIQGYYTRFESMPFPWHLTTGHLDGERVLLLLGGLSPPMEASVVVRFDIQDGKIHDIRHYS